VLLRQLEYLSALARERHFARAAESCHVSQPALSAAIRKLEAELDVQIVRRGRRFEGFTPEGETVVRWAHQILAEQSSLRQELSSMRAGLSGVLRIGAIPTALTAASLLTTPFCEQHPEVRISLDSMSSREILHGLADFELDAGMTYVDGEALGSVRTVPLYRERYLLLTPAGSEFADRTSVGWAELAKTPLALLSPIMQNRRILDRNFTEAGVSVTPSIESNTISVLYAHVATHRWSTVIAHAWLLVFGAPDGTRVVPMERPRRSYQVGLVLADRDPEPLMARALLDVAHRVDMYGDLDQLLRRHVGTIQPERWT
jgi:DNA-binding transcriptional LysR family regulator